MTFDFIELLVAFAGGVFGAAIGAFPVWTLCGLAVLIGATINLVNGNPDFMNIVAWGSFFGPHTSFAGGVAAAAYAAKKKCLPGGGRDIATPLIGLNRPDILFVGGVFGGLGYLILLLIMQVPDYSDIAWTNTVALAVILNMFVIRWVLGSTGLFGRSQSNRWIPTEKGSWVIYQSSPGQLILLSIAVGVPAAYFAIILPGSSGLVFGFVTFLLVFMIFGFKVPVTHHIALSSSMVTAATGSIAWGVAWGVLAAFLGELSACMFLYHGDTHIDPPTMALVLTFTIFPIASLLGVFTFTGIFVWVVPIGIALAGYGLLTFLRKAKV